MTQIFFAGRGYLTSTQAGVPGEPERAGEVGWGGPPPLGRYMMPGEVEYESELGLTQPIHHVH